MKWTNTEGKTIEAEAAKLVKHALPFTLARRQAIKDVNRLFTVARQDR